MAAELADKTDVTLIALDDALSSLAVIDPLQSRIIALRIFGGLTVEETADVLRVSVAKIKREWRIAKAWLLRELSRQSLTKL